MVSTRGSRIVRDARIAALTNVNSCVHLRWLNRGSAAAFSRPTAFIRHDKVRSTRGGRPASGNAARQGRLRKVRGLGTSVERKIIEGVAMMLDAEGSIRVNCAKELLLHA